jgi:tetratricopeptide (TPR) repeat protein
VVEVRDKVRAAGAVKNWQEVLKWEGRMEELLENSSNEECVADLRVFITAHMLSQLAMGSTYVSCGPAALWIARLQERRVELLGKMERFRDQGEGMCTMASSLNVAGKREEAEKWYQRARNVGAAHGFFSVESSACLGLGKLAMDQGRHEEGVELLRNALVAANLSEHEGEEESNREELGVLDSLIEALFKIAGIDEVEPLVVRYRELAKAEMERMGGLPYKELWSLYFNARLHEVPCICSPC